MNGPLTQRVLSRRQALAAGSTGLAVALGAPGFGQPAAAASQPRAPLPQAADLAGDVVAEFARLPGQKALKLWAPTDGSHPEWTASLNPSLPLFVGSSFKAFVLAEYLRQVEAALDPASATPLEQQLTTHLAEQWPLDSSVWSLDSPVFNPPHLTGQVQALTALEAMISRSDNTGADMTLAHAGADRVKEFVSLIGLRDTRIPTSTRQFIGYVTGQPDWPATTWAQMEANSNYPPRPIINDQITMVSTPDDLVSFYARALRGDFFQHPETLAQFRAILSLADAIAMVMPLGVSAFLKGGAINYNGHHALAVGGGLYGPSRWVYFGLLLNWTDADAPAAAAVEQQLLAAAKAIFLRVRDGLGS